MFKKIEIWILYLVISASILFAIGFGSLVRQELVGSIKAGWISETALNLAEIPINLRDTLRPINRSRDRFPSLEGFTGTPNTQESYLLLSRYDGDLKEGVVELVDLTNFKLLHVWNPDIDAFNNLVEQKDEFKYLDREQNDSRSIFRHPKLTTEGGLLFKGFSPLRKIDACSNLIFQNTHDIFHHSIETDIEGNIWVPSYLYPPSLPSKKVGTNIREKSGYLDDAIVKLSSDGQIIYEKSVSQIFIDNGLEYLLFSVGDSYAFAADPIHLNDIQPVDYDGQYWKKGDVFLSLRHQSMVLLYRPSTNKIIWKGTGLFFHQHDVDILDDHRISIFNNNSKDLVDRDVVDGHNQVIIYDFETNEYSTYLSNSLIRDDVRTITQGRSEILSNGDLFIGETNYGRTLYFNADGSMRWSHVNRADDGNVYILGWSRILYTQDDIQTVNNFLESKGTCNE
jgi:hypothetical protein